MALSSTVQREFAKAIASMQTSSGSETLIGTVQQDTGMVLLDGSTAATPISSTTAGLVAGDRVIVQIKDHKTTVLGNFSNPSVDRSSYEREIKEVDQLIAGKVSADQLEADIATVESLIADKATIEQLKANDANIYSLVAKQADIDDLKAKNATIENLVAQKADIKTLEAEYATIKSLEAVDSKFDTLDAKYASIENLEATNASIQELDAKKASIDDVAAKYATIENLEATDGKIDNLESKAITTDNLDAQVANIALANMETATVKELQSKKAIVTNAMIADAAIDDAKVLGLSGNKITTGELDASKVTVTNLNAKNITTGTLKVGGVEINVDEGTANVSGSAIESGAITADKLSQEVQDEIDGAIETWSVDAVPTAQNEPEVNWTTDAEKKKHVGDVAYVVNSSSEQSGYMYRYGYDTTSKSYVWTLIKDTDVTAALQKVEEVSGNLIKFEQESNTYQKKTDSSIETLINRTTTLESDIGTKVRADEFADYKQSVDENISTLTKFKETAEGDITNISQSVSDLEQTAESISQKVTEVEKNSAKSSDFVQTKDGIWVSASSTEFDADSNIADNLDSHESKLQMLADSLKSIVQGSYSSTEYTQTENGFKWTFNGTTIEQKISNATDSLQSKTEAAAAKSELEDKLTDLANALSGQQTKTDFMQVATTWNGDKGLIIGSTSAQLSVQITSTQMAFVSGWNSETYGGTAIAYITGDLFHIAKGVLTEELHIGDETTGSWVWKKRANNHLGLRWVAGAA